MSSGSLVFGDRPQDPDAPDCKAAMQALLDEGIDVLVSACTYAEVVRWGHYQSVPRFTGVIPVAFDEPAAEKLGKHFPMKLLEKIKAETGTSKTCLKLDSMIVASAIRYGVGFHLSKDADHVRLCETAGLPCFSPRAFLISRAKTIEMVYEAEAEPAGAAETAETD